MKMEASSKKYLLSKIIFLTFKILGLAPWSLGKPEAVEKFSNCTWQIYNHQQCKNSRFGRFYNVIIIIFELYMWWFVAEPKQADVTYPGKSKLTANFEFFLALWGNAVVVLVWSMYIIKQNDFVILINRLTQIDATLERIDENKKSANGKNSDLKNGIILIATNAFVLIILLIIEYLAFDAPFITWFCFVVPCIITNWFLIQYFLALKSIEARFRYLNTIFRYCSINSIVFPLHCFLIDRATIEDLQVPKIVNLRRAHTFLYEISCDLANFYSLPILLSIGFVSLLCLYNAYYLLVPFVIKMEAQTNMMVFNSIFWLFVLMTPIIMLAAGVNGVTAEMKKTAYIIPDLLARRTTNAQDRIEIKMFCFDLLHKDIEFTAYKFFPLDGTLVQSVVGTVATYLTIIFQLQTGSSRSASHVDSNITKVK